MFKSLRTRLFLWYLLSLSLIGVFFYIFVHILALKYGLEIVLGLFVVLAVIGFVIIYQITKSIIQLSNQMKKVTTKNLDDRISIKGNDEISELSSSFNSLLDRLSDAFKREQQFIADVAHEIKTPLATLRSLIEVSLEKPRSNEEYRKIMEESLLASNRISKTLKNVLDLAWSEAPTGRVLPKQFDISNLLLEVVEIAEKLAIKKKITIKSEIAPNIQISGYSDKLVQAILNIVDNAVKYTPEGGTVTVRFEVEPKRVVIGISDTGPGIPQEDILYIFDRFYRSRQTEQVGGSGLGLAISKAIIALHNGEIWVKSVVGEGTTFVIVLPKLNLIS